MRDSIILSKKDGLGITIQKKLITPDTPKKTGTYF
jgi:hypothetical protein